MLNLDEKGFSVNREQQEEFIHHTASDYGKERYIRLSYSVIEEELSKRLESYSVKLKEAIEEAQKVAKEEDLLIRGAGNEVARGLDEGELKLDYYGMLDTKSTQKVIDALRKDFDIRAVGTGSVALRGGLYTVVIGELVNTYFIEEALSNSFFYYIRKVLNLIEEAQVMHAKKDTLDERVEEIQNFMKETGIVFAPHLVSTAIDSPIEVEEVESAYVAYKDILELHEDIQEITDNYLGTVKRNNEGNKDLGSIVLNLPKAKEEG